VAQRTNCRSQQPCLDIPGEQAVHIQEIIPQR
jgi:hypothetical protein